MKSYYFSHDCNAQHDPKITKLLVKMGWEGYGLFWALVERLSSETDYRMKIEYDCIAFALRTDEDRIKNIIEDYDLFTIKGKYFYSERLNKCMALRDEKSEKARRSVQKRWDKTKKENTNVLLPNNERNTIKGNESILDKSKEDNKKKIIKRKSLEVRKQEFSTSVKVFEKEFSKKLCNDFIAYWTEKNPSGRKMRFEMQKTFENKRRLTTWNNNNFNNGKKNRFISDDDYDHQKREERRLQENKELKKKYSHIFNQ